MHLTTVTLSAVGIFRLLTAIVNTKLAFKTAGRSFARRLRSETNVARRGRVASRKFGSGQHQLSLVRDHGALSGWMRRAGRAADICRVRPKTSGSESGVNVQQCEATDSALYLSHTSFFFFFNKSGHHLNLLHLSVCPSCVIIRDADSGLTQKTTQTVSSVL